MFKSKLIYKTVAVFMAVTILLTAAFGIVSVYCNYKQQKNWPLEQECNQKVKEYCKGLKNVYYVDVTEVLTDGNAPRPGVISDDGIHMSENGYALWNTVIVPIVKQMLGNENK